MEVQLSETCLLKSARAYMSMSALDELGDVLRSIPTVDELEKENFERSFQVLLLSDVEAVKVEQALMSISEVEKVTVFQRDYLKFINSSHAELIEQINKQQKLDDDLEENIKKSIEEFKASYTV